MKNNYLIPLLIVSSFFSFAQTPKATISLTHAQWQADIKYFQQELVKRHKNVFHHVSKEVFEKYVEQLYNDAPSLQDYQIIVRLQQITAKVGDGHTNVHIPLWFKRYPVGLRWFDDDLYVISATEQYKEAVGTRVVKIDELSLEEVYQRIKAVFSQDENKWYDMNSSPWFLTKPEVLVTLGIVPEYDRASFTFVDSIGKEIKLELIPVPSTPNANWISASNAQPLFRQKLNDPFWFTYLEDINAVYVNFKNYDNLKQDADKLFKFISEKKATRLVVDLRQNGGGDFKKGRRLLLEPIKNNTVINQKGNLFVITGRFTFSAAMVNAIDFKKETNAIIIGEPPGEKPNSYSENGEMKLPNSGLVISYSTRYYKFLDEDVPAFEPDVRIDPSWKEFKEGRDAVLEWITANCKK